MNRYLNTGLHHHSAKLQTDVKTLVTRLEKLADTHSKKQELNIVKSALPKKGNWDQHSNSETQAREIRKEVHSLSTIRK